MTLLIDRTIDFLRRGYRFGDAIRSRSRDAKAHHRVPLHLFGLTGILVRGREGVRLFYDNDRIQRRGAMPSFIGGGLFGKGSVHGLDDRQHLVRKATFVRAAMDPKEIDRLVGAVRDEWQGEFERWEDGRTVYDAAVDVIGRAAIRWAGFDLSREKLTELARWEAQIVDGFAVVGPAHLLEAKRRKQCDAFFAEQMRKARAGEITPPAGSAFQLICDHVEADGTKLSDQIAGVEIQNCFRPTIAVARFAAFAALALIEHPEWAERIRAEAVERGTTIDGEIATAFAQEIRRFYPFVPMLPARARQDFEHDGLKVAKGERVVLDFYGTLHDEEEWANPHEFDPTHFLGTDADESEVFIPQGGGDPRTGHRCPGEGFAVGILAVTAAELAIRDWTVPEQDLSYSMSRMPTLPGEGVRLNDMGAPAL